MSDLPVVSVWASQGTTWRLTGQLGNYSELAYEPRHNDVGDWSMSLPYDTQALKILTDRLVTFDWRGTRTTGIVTTHNPATDDTGQPVLNVAGVTALGILARSVAYPSPGNPLTNQQYYAPDAPAPLNGPAETVALNIIAGNLVTRRGDNITVPASLGRGSTVRARPNFENVLELATTKATAGGIGLDVNLVNTTGTQANLTVQVYVPQDRSRRVRLSEQAGNLRGWSQTSEAPTVTRAIVGGAGGGTTKRYRAVTTPDSVAAATAWGGHREAFIDGPQTFDDTELDQAGEEQLTSGAATVSLSCEAAEAAGLLAFRHYYVGDIAAADLFNGFSMTDVISSIRVSVDSDGVTVTPKFGDPDADDTDLSLIGLVRALQTNVKTLQARR